MLFSSSSSLHVVVFVVTVIVVIVVIAGMRVCNLPFVHFKDVREFFRHVRPVAYSILALFFCSSKKVSSIFIRFNLSHRFLSLVCVDDPEDPFNFFAGIPLFCVSSFETFPSQSNERVSRVPNARIFVFFATLVDSFQRDDNHVTWLIVNRYRHHRSD